MLTFYVTHMNTHMQTQTQRPPISQEQLQLIKHTVARGASNDELKLFMIIATRAGLDPFTKQIHYVKRGAQGTIQTGIDGYRAIAERSGSLAGIDDPIYDTETESHPNKATVKVYRIVNDQRVEFSASARWNEYVPSPGQDFMWRKMPYLMLGKVAEALALRKAFPNDLSGIYTDAEMEQAATENSFDGANYESVPDLDGNPEQQPITPNNTRTVSPSETQMRTIEKLMKQKGYSEQALHDEGFPPLSELTGGRAGTASKVIDWLIKAKRS
jgi:phage recombination protein Bet